MAITRREVVTMAGIVVGAEGVARVVNVLRREFEMAMALTGRVSVGEIDSTALWPARS